MFAVLLAAGTTAGALTVPASPAAAAPGPVVLVSATSASNSATAKSAVAACPDDHPYVYSAGGQVTGGTGLVTLTDAYALGDLRSVVAWGHENGSYAGSWSVSAYATCGTSSQVQRVTEATASDGSPGKSITARCPGATTLYGVGWEMTGAFGTALPTAARPNNTVTALTVEAYASNGYAANWKLIAHAICGPRPASLSLQTSIGDPDYAGPRTELAPGCPVGTARYAVGGEIVGSGADGYLALSKLGSGEPGTTGETLGWWWYWLFQTVSYSICAP